MLLMQESKPGRNKPIDLRKCPLYMWWKCPKESSLDPRKKPSEKWKNFSIKTPVVLWLKYARTPLMKQA